MKSFTTFQDALNWTKTIIAKTKVKTIENIAKDVYVDSKEFTYLDTEDMYNSGRDSNFKDGFVTIKAPQVRKLYYINARGRRNPNATVQWFETTKRKNMDKYSKQFSIDLKQIKGG